MARVNWLTPELCKACRNYLGLSHVRFADELIVATSTVADYENKKPRGYSATPAKIEKYLYEKGFRHATTENGDTIILFPKPKE